MPATTDIATDPSITEVTRRAIKDSLVVEGITWYGDLSEVEFLQRIFDLEKMPSTDHRFKTASSDIWQHRVNNFDWDEYWVFSDSRFALTNGADETFLRFLTEMVHPAVRGNISQNAAIVKMLNDHLAPDGWELGERTSLSGRPVYAAHRILGGKFAINSVKAVAEVIDAAYIHRQITRMEQAVDEDPENAIGSAKELIETCCRTILGDRGKTVTDKPDVLPLVRRTMEELKLVPEGIPDEARGAKTIKALLGNLATMSQNLAELRNLYGTGHGKDGRAKGLMSRHARLAVGASSTLAVFLFDTHQEKAVE